MCEKHETHYFAKTKICSERTHMPWTFDKPTQQTQQTCGLRYYTSFQNYTIMNNLCILFIILAANLILVDCYVTCD